MDPRAKACSKNPIVRPRHGRRSGKHDAECTTAPRRILKWVLPLEETHELFSTGHGTALDLIYTRGVPYSPSLDSTSLNKTQCALIVIEIGLYRDFGCDNKIAEKIEKDSPSPSSRPSENIWDEWSF
jgi:hypothetical protein